MYCMYYSYNTISVLAIYTVHAHDTVLLLSSNLKTLVIRHSSQQRLSEGPNGLYYQNDGLRYNCIVLCHYCIIYQCLSSIATPYGPLLISKQDLLQESLLCSLLEIHPYVCKRLRIRMCVIYKSIFLFLYSTERG